MEFEPARMHDANAALHRLVVAVVDGVAHEGDLAGEVRVVRSRLDAREHERHSEPAIRADGRGDHARARRQRVQRCAVVGTCLDERPRPGSRPEAGPDRG